VNVCADGRLFTYDRRRWSMQTHTDYQGSFGFFWRLVSVQCQRLSYQDLFVRGTGTWWARIAQSVQPLATGWTVRGLNRGGGEIFRTRSDRPWSPPSLLYNGYRVFPAGKAAGACR